LPADIGGTTRPPLLPPSGQAPQAKPDGRVASQDVDGDATTAKPAAPARPQPANPGVRPADVKPNQEIAAKEPSPPAARPANVVPVAAIDILRLDDAKADQDYVATLPPFADKNDLASLKLRVEPRLPPGLLFADRGSGFGVISGKPTEPGRFVFDVVATDPAGASARMSTSITVAAAVKPPPPTSQSRVEPVAVNPQEKLARLVQNFDGGPCFYIRSYAATDTSASIEGFGADTAAFERLEGDFRRANGFDPQINLRKVTSDQCAAVDFLKTTGTSGTDSPAIEVTSFDVGRGKPLTGRISGFGERHLDLLMVSDDGLVVSLNRAVQAGRGTAKFDVTMTADPRSVGAPQLLIALASQKPIDALSGFRSAPAAEILPILGRELEAGGAASLDVKLFKLVD
jgi:hypothetical protein